MKYLFEIRKKRGLSQAELAFQVGIQQSSLARYERGEMQPTIKVVEAIAEALNVSINELLNGPEGERSHVTLSYDWKKFEKGDVDMAGKGYELFLGADGVVGIKGSMLLKSKEAIKNFLAEIEEQLTVGYEAQERRGALKEKGE